MGAPLRCCLLVEFNCSFDSTEHLEHSLMARRNISEDLSDHLRFWCCLDSNDTIGELFRAALILLSIQASIHRIVLEELERLGQVSITRLYAKGGRAALHFLQSADS